MYRDPNTYYPVSQQAGVVDGIEVTDTGIDLFGTLVQSAVDTHQIDQVVILDDANRFVSANSPDGLAWRVAIHRSSIGNDNSAIALKCFASNRERNTAFSIKMSSEIAAQYREHVAALLPHDTRDIPTFRQKLRELITTGVKEPYISRSIRNSIKTGNRYQELNLGDGTKYFGRQDRGTFLKKFDFRGKTVLDIGANTGENSRIVRMLGASLVDGYEYDPYFVEIGRAINALNGTTRVSLFQGDCTRDELFDGMKYDIIVAFSVWVYLTETIKLLPRIAPVMIFETHTLDHGMNFYYERILPYFPYAVCLGLTDVSADPHLARAVILFSTDQKILQTASRRFLRVLPYFSNPFIQKHSALSEQQAWRLAQDCFNKRSSEKKWTGKEYGFGKEGYFEILLAGLHQFRLDKDVTAENIFLKFLVAAVNAGLVDPELRTVVSKESWLRRKLGNKFEDMVQIISGFPDRVPPIRLNLDPNGHLTFTSVDGEEFRCREIDGHHRYFTCQLMGVDRIAFYT